MEVIDPFPEKVVGSLRLPTRAASLGKGCEFLVEATRLFDAKPASEVNP